MATIFVLGKSVFSATKYGPLLAVGGAPIVILLAVIVLHAIVLAVRLLIVVLFIITFDATKRILPLVVKNSPEPFVIELVARRFCT